MDLWRSPGRRVVRHPVQAQAGQCTVLQRCKQPGNQATKQPSNQATRQPGNQATRQLGLCPPTPNRAQQKAAAICAESHRDACKQRTPVSSTLVARDAASLARRLESPPTSTARADFQFHLGDDAHSTINFHPSRSPGTRPHWPDASSHRRPRLHARFSGSTSAATCIPLSTFIHPGQQGRGLDGPTPRIAVDLDCTRGFPVPPRRRRAFHYQLSSIPVARDAASLARHFESPSTSTACAAFRFHLGGDAYSTLNPQQQSQPLTLTLTRFPIPDSRFPLPTPHR